MIIVLVMLFISLVALVGIWLAYGQRHDDYNPVQDRPYTTYRS